MKAAVVLETGKSPVYGDFAEPVPGDDEVLVHVTASALTHFTKVRAAGRHPSFAAAPPFVAGIDGTGRLADGRRVYFLFPRAPHGGMAERTVVPAAHCVAVPDGVADVTLAAIADPGMSSWVALELRAKLAPGETVLVNGATGTAGRMAVRVARHLGAGKVIATGRNEEALSSLGADAVISLAGDSETTTAALREQYEQGVDVVLDYLWGPSAEQLLAAASASRRRAPIRFVQIGTASASTLTLPGMALRSAALQIMGSGIGTVAVGEIMGILAKLMQAAPRAAFPVATRSYPLARVADVWLDEGGTMRTVFTIGACSSAARGVSGSSASPASPPRRPSRDPTCRR